MRCRWLSVGPLVAVVAVAGCAGALAQPDDESLRDSFAKVSRAEQN